MWPLLLDTKPKCLFSASAQLARVNDDRPVRLLHILKSALHKSAVLQFHYGIAIRNSADFIEASRRTPTTAVDSVLQRSIERCAINARLSAGNNLQGIRDERFASKTGSTLYLSYKQRNRGLLTVIYSQVDRVLTKLRQL